MHKNAYGQTVFDSPEEAMNYARAEAQGTPTGDGLIRKTKYDVTGRPIHEYESTTGKKDWLNQFRAPIQQQIRIANSNQAAAEISKGQAI